MADQVSESDLAAALAEHFNATATCERWPANDGEGSDGVAIPVTLVDEPGVARQVVVHVDRFAETAVADLLLALQARGIPVAPPVAHLTISGVPCIVTERLRGGSLRGAILRESLTVGLIGAITGLAQAVHAVAIADFPPAVQSAAVAWNLRTRADALALLAREASKDELASWLVDVSAAVSAVESRCICHGDLTQRNILVDEGVVTGLVDWSSSLITVGPAVLDAGILVASLLLDTDRRVSATASVMRRAFLDSHDEQSLELSTTWALLQVATWVAARASQLSQYPGADAGPRTSPLDDHDLRRRLDALLDWRARRITWDF